MFSKLHYLLTWDVGFINLFPLMYFNPCPPVWIYTLNIMIGGNSSPPNLSNKIRSDCLSYCNKIGMRREFGMHSLTHCTWILLLLEQLGLSVNQLQEEILFSTLQRLVNVPKESKQWVEYQYIRELSLISYRSS